MSPARRAVNGRGDTPPAAGHPGAGEHGAALPLALLCLLVLMGLVMAFFTVSAFEPQISANHEAGTQARYLAEAGLEWGFEQLAANGGSWNGLLATNRGLLTRDQPLPGLSPEFGTFTVNVRNDVQPGDQTMTGVPVEPSANATRDTNDRVILTAVGTVANATRTITAVVRRATPPPFNAALAFPGVQADVNVSDAALTIYGTDWNMDGTAGSAAPVHGIAVAPGDTANRTIVQNAVVNNPAVDVRGLRAGAPPAVVAGEQAVVAPDPAGPSHLALTSQAVSDFVNAVKTQAHVTVDVRPDTTARFTDIGGTCATNASGNTCWGTPSAPKIVYVRGNMDAATQFTGLEIAGSSAGTGILIVEGTGASITGRFTWNGPVILTGPNVGLQYRAAGGIFGSLVVNELSPDAGVQLESDSRAATIRYSSQALDVVRSRLGRTLFRMYSWREQ